METALEAAAAQFPGRAVRVSAQAHLERFYASLGFVRSSPIYDDAGIPTDPRLRLQLIAWFTWATALLNHRWATPDEVPSDLPMVSWDWEGTEGW